MIIESHAHYSHHKFDQTFRFLSYKNGQFSIEEGNKWDLIEGFKEKGVAASIEPAIGIESNDKIHHLSSIYPNYIFLHTGAIRLELIWQNGKTERSLSVMHGFRLINASRSEKRVLIIIIIAKISTDCVKRDGLITRLCLHIS